MQPFVAGLALGALPTMPVLLAGGSQMAAVLALIVALARERDQPLDLDRIGIATTSWVARDPTADLAGLVAQIADVPVFASDLNFAESRHVPLRRYEDFLVKEGVGAGAAAVVAALLAGRRPRPAAGRHRAGLRGDLRPRCHRFVTGRSARGLIQSRR